ncbi:MAG: LysR family transcriptional regulator [Oscillospiraceae bacterium]
MNFQQLKYYTVLCEIGSFSKAAESLFISQQGLSMAISNLEAEFSCKFFIRTPKGLVLTEDGKYFRDWSLKMLDNLKECWEHFEGRDAEQGVIKCAGVQGTLSEFGTGLINRFESTYQGYSVYLREYKDRLCDKIMENEEAEIGFGLEPTDESKFEGHPVFQTRFVCLLPMNHPWVALERIPLSLLAQEVLITVDETFKSADWFLKMCAERGVKIKPKFRCGEITAVHRLVREQQGVGLTVQSVAEALATPDTVWRPFDDDSLLWTIDIIKKKSVKLSRGARIFYEYTQRQAATDYREMIAPARIMEQELTD